MYHYTSSLAFCFLALHLESWGLVCDMTEPFRRSFIYPQNHKIRACNFAIIFRYFSAPKFRVFSGISQEIMMVSSQLMSSLRPAVIQKYELHCNGPFQMPNWRTFSRNERSGPEWVTSVEGFFSWRSKEKKRPETWLCFRRIQLQGG